MAQAESPVKGPQADAKEDESSEMTLKDFKKNCDLLTKNLKEEKKSIAADLAAFKTLVEQVRDGSVPEEFRAYFIDQVLTRGLDVILSRSFALELALVDEVHPLLHSVVDLCIAKLPEDIQPVASALNKILGDDATFYKLYGADEPSGKPAELEDSEELKAFRAKIEFSDWIDVFHNNKWKTAQIIEESEDQTKWRLQYESIIAVTPTMEWIEKDSLRMAPLHSKSRANIDQWRLDLVVGSHVDALDTVNKWYTSTVIAVNGDIITINYDGWSSKFDEAITRTSERFAPHKTMAQGGKESGGVQHLPTERIIDDKDDPEDVAAIFRGREWGTWFQVQHVLYFAEKGGFDAVLSRAQNHTPNAPVQYLRALLDAVAQTVNILAKPFVVNYAPKLRDAVFETILGLNDTELRALSKEHLEEIVKDIRVLLRRFEKADVVRSALEQFELRTALLRLHSPIVERRINGMTFISDAVNKVRGHSHLRSSMTGPEMVVWLAENKILETCYGKNSHPELMKRSVDVLKFLAQENALSEAYMQMIWDATKIALSVQDTSTVDILFKVLSDISWQMTAEHVEFVFKGMRALSFADYVIPTLDLVKELTRLTYKIGPAAAEQAMSLLWDVIQDGSGASQDISKAAQQRLEGILCDMAHKEHRERFIHLCVESLKTHKSVPQSLDLLRRIVDTYPPQPTTMETTTCWSIIQGMQEKLGFLDHFFADLEHFKAQVAEADKLHRASNEAIEEQKAAKKKKKKPFSANNYVAPGSYEPYLSSLKKRLSFLAHVLGNSSLSLNKEQIDSLWRQLYECALTSEEREHCLRWLKGLVDNTGNSNFTAFSAELTHYLFNEKMTKTLDVSNLSLAGYECIERYFVFLNRLDEKIEFKRIGESKTIFQVLKFELFESEDFNVLWRIALEATHEGVMRSCISFLNKIHEQLSDSLRGSVRQIRSNYISKCMKHFKEYVDSKDFNRIRRCLSLLNHLLDASEAKGIGGLRSHGAQLRGRVMKVRVVNNVARSQAAQKRIDIKIFSNDTLWELREACAKATGIPPDLTRMFYKGKELEDAQNAKNLSELRIREPVVLNVSRRHLVQDRVTLVDTHGVMHPLLTIALNHIFSRFASNENKTMNKEDMATYIMACGAGPSSASPKRISDIFKLYGDDAAGELPADGFVQFYKDACAERPEAVWNDLGVHGFRNDLRHQDDVEKEEMQHSEDEKALPRYILSSSNEYFTLLFQSLNLDADVPDVAQQIWQLLQRLPTNPSLKHDLVSLERVQNPTPDWNSLLDTRSPYKLLYSLQIIESLTEPHEEAESKGSDATPQLEERVEWRRRFLLSGGFKHLYRNLIDQQAVQSPKAQAEVLSSEAADAADADASVAEVVSVSQVVPEKKDGHASTTVQRRACALLLKMLRTLILGAISVNGSMMELFQKVRIESAATRRQLAEDGTAAATAAAEAEAPTPVMGPQEVGPDGIPPAPPVPPYALDAIDLTGEPPGLIDSDGQMVGPLLPGQERPPAAVAAAAVNMSETKQKEQKQQGDDDNAGDDAKNDEEEEPMPDAAFKALVRQMSSGFATKLLEFMDLAELQSALLILLQKCSQPDATATDGQVVEYAMSLLVAIVLYKPDELLPALYQFFSEDTLLELLRCQEETGKIRREVASGLYQLCHFCEPETERWPHLFFLDLLVKSITEPKQASADVIDSAERFWLLSKLLDDAIQGKCDAKPADFKPLVGQIVERLKTHVTSEQDEHSPADQLLIGLMKVMITLCQVPEFRKLAGLRSAGGLVQDVFNNFLFYGKLPPQDADIEEKMKIHAETPKDPRFPKCKVKTSRAVAFQLLVNLSTDAPENLSELLSYISEQQNTVTVPDTFSYNPEKHMMSPVGYVGLRNLGATCYMNSLLQQFYMVPEFRYGVLMADDNEADKSDSLLYQLQTLFGFLSFSKKQAFDTESFCRSYKDENGNPINVRIQQDAQEFFNVLADRLETRLKGTPQANLLKHLFGGEMTNQLICHGGCNTVRERNEAFYTVSLEVKNKSNLLESLDSYVQGENLSDFNCSTCNRKVDITKRAVFGSLSSHVIFHLKRFELNFETFQHEKLNNRFEFPPTVNLEPFTKEGLARKDAEQKRTAWLAEHAAGTAAPEAADGKGGDDDGKGAEESAAEAEASPAAADSAADECPIEVPKQYSVFPEEYYEYQLVGILVHTGNAQGGHYYSFIKERQPRLGRTECEWFEFNDTYIKPFDFSKVEEECFGGEHQVVESSAWGSEWSRPSERIKNAYMLVYKRVKRWTPPPPEPPRVPEVESSSSEDGKDANAIEQLKKLVEEKEKEKESYNNMLQVEEAAQTADLREIVPARIVQGAEDDNDRFMRDRQLWSAQYFSFINDVLKIPPSKEILDPEVEDSENPGIELIRLGTNFALDVLTHAGENDIFPELMGHLQNHYKKNLPACRWLIEYLCAKPDRIVEHLLTVREPLIRKGFLDLVVCALQLLYPLEIGFFNEEVEVRVEKKALAQDDEAPQPEFKHVPRSCVVRFIHVITSLVPRAPKMWVRFADFFHLFSYVAELGPEARKVMVQRKLIAILGDLFLGEKSPHRDRSKKLVQMGNRMVQPDFGHLLRTMSMLVRSCTTESTAEHGPPPSAINEGDLLCPISEADKQVLLTREFYTESLVHGHAPSAIGEIIGHWAYENPLRTDEVVRIILHGVERASHDNVKPYFDIMKAFCCVKDSLQKDRFEKLLEKEKGVLWLLHYYRTQYTKFTYLSIKMMLEILEASPEFAEFMMEKREEWIWMDTWLKQYISKKYPPQLRRQKSKESTYNKYQAQLEKLGGTLTIQEEKMVTVDSDNEVDMGPGRPRSHSDGDANGPEGPSNKRARGGSDTEDMDIDEVTNRMGGLHVSGQSVGREMVAVGPASDISDSPYRDHGPPPSMPAGVWACGICTFENQSPMRLCAMCNTPRGNQPLQQVDDNNGGEPSNGGGGESGPTAEQLAQHEAREMQSISGGVMASHFSDDDELGLMDDIDYDGPPVSDAMAAQIAADATDDLTTEVIAAANANRRPRGDSTDENFDLDIDDKNLGLE